MTRVFNPLSRGDSFATDYTIGDDPIVKFKTLRFKVEGGNQIEAGVLRRLAQEHNVSITQINIIHIIKVTDFK